MIAQKLNLQELPLGLRDIDDDAFERVDRSIRQEDALVDVQYPFSLAGCGHNFVLISIVFMRGQVRFAFLPYGLAVLRQDDIVKRDATVLQQIFRLVTGQLKTTAGDKLHGPVSITDATIGHAGQVSK
ncbi:hypothetical protein SDC9_152152 [bioreactor metagenome]|uniref:Uncharacterized protein n=1 Tax=bioreactor metagenome TaxID=1076179 RepID=A0A645EWS2_9ZZZZ